MEDAAPTRTAVAAAVKDEAAFLVEWVAWYRMLGFDRILVAHNDCTDPTPEILGVFARAGWLDPIPHRPRPGQPPKASAHRAIRRHPATAATEWLLICDVDEYLVLHDGPGDIAGFLDAPGRAGDRRRAAQGVAFHWRSFGSGGQAQWSDTPVHRSFTQAAAPQTPANAPFKTLFRDPLRFAAYGAHGPRRFDGAWGENGRFFVDADGRRLYRYDAQNRPQMATAAGRVTHRHAQMNHYVIRWEDSFALKRGTPSASAGLDRYTDAFYAKYNRNETTDIAVYGYRARFDRVHAAAMALPGMARLHHLGCAHYAARLARAAGRPPETDPRVRFHRNAAEAAR